MSEGGAGARRRVEVQLLTSPDLPDMDERAPDDPTDFCILVQALVGLEGEEGADTFDFLVCTPNRVAGLIPDGGVLPGRTYLFVHRYDYATIRGAIQSFCDRASVGRDWRAVAQILARWGRWEYEDAVDAGEL